MIVNPIIHRELVGLLRTRWALAIQVGCPLVFSLLILVRWPSDQQIDLAGTRSQQIFALFGYGLLALQLLLAPVFPATAIVQERVRGTLTQLLNTPMRPWSIYFGKLAGVVGFTNLPLVLSLPAVAACYAMGNLSVMGDVVPLYAVLFVANFLFTAIGLWVSSLTASTDSALRTTYGLLLLICVVSLGPYQFLQGSSPGLRLTLAEWARAASPIAAVMEVVQHGNLDRHGLIAATGTLSGYFLISLLMTAAAIIHTIRRLNPRAQERPRPQGVITDDRSRAQRWLRRLFFVSDPQRRTKPIGDYTNPVMVKEFRSRRFGRSQWMMRMVAVSALASVALTYFAATGTIAWGVETIGGLMVLLQAALIILVTPAMAAGLISAEHESGHWTLLQMTELPAHRIVAGKLLSVAWPAALVLLATLPGYAVMMFIQPVLQPQILRTLATLVLGAAFALLLSAAVSSLMTKTATATLIACGLLVSLWGGTLLFWLGRERPFGHDLVEIALACNPVAAALSIIKQPGFAQYELVPANWYVMAFACAVALAVLTTQTWRLTRPR